MKRYSPIVETPDDPYYDWKFFKMYEEKNGTYVKYEDVVELLKDNNLLYLLEEKGDSCLSGQIHILDTKT